MTEAPESRPVAPVTECVASIAKLIEDTCYLLANIARNDLGRAAGAVIAADDIKTLEVSVERYQAVGSLTSDERSNLTVSL